MSTIENHLQEVNSETTGLKYPLPSLSVPDKFPHDNCLPDLRISIHRDLDQVAAIWQTFETSAACTLFQSFDWIEAWQRHAAQATHEQLAVAIGWDPTNTPLMILPLALKRRFGLLTLSWYGQDHANYNLGLFDPEFMKSLQAEDVQKILKAIAAALPDIAMVEFTNQPVTWDGIENPLHKLPNQASPSAAYSLRISDNFEELYHARIGKKTRSSLRRKEKKLRSFGDYGFERAENNKERITLFEHFLEQKAVQFAHQGIHNIFAEPHIKAFYRDLTERRSDDKLRLDFNALMVGGNIASTFNGIEFNKRFYLLISSITPNEAKRWSPGLILMRDHIEYCCQKGDKIYDFGTGEADHKSAWANEQIDLFDSYIPLKPTAIWLVLLMKLKSKAKRTIKRNTKLWSLAKYVRRTLKK